MIKPAFQKLRKGGLTRLKVCPALHFGYQASALDLRLPLGAREAMPLPTPLASRGIVQIEDDGPMARRSFAEMTPHFRFSSSTRFGPRLIQSRTRSRLISSGELSGPYKRAALLSVAGGAFV